MKWNLHHLALRVRRLERSKRFYVEQLGFSYHPKSKKLNSKSPAVWLKLGRAILMLELSQAPQRKTAKKSRFLKENQPGIHLLAFSISRNQRQALKARFKKRGISIVHETAYTIYVRDPDGNRLGFSHYPQKT